MNEQKPQVTDLAPRIPQDADTYLDFLGVIGVMRMALFEVIGERKYWNERYVDLFTSMLMRHLRGTAVTLEDMTSSITGVSHSTKVRMIEEARKDGLILAVNRSAAGLDSAAELVGARKVFFLADETMEAILAKLDVVMEDVVDFAHRLDRAQAAETRAKSA